MASPDTTNVHLWNIVILGFLVLAVSYSVRATLSLIMPIWEQEFGWSREYISGVAAFALINMAILAPLAGRIVDRHGPRMVLIYGLLAVAIGCFIIAATDSKILFMIAFGGIAAIGFGLIATHVVSTAIEQNFTSHQGLAIGVSTSGSTGGPVIVVPLIAVLLTFTNWRVSFAILGLICLVILLLVLRLLPRNTTQKPDNETDQANDWVQDIIFVCKQPAFHILFWSYVICGYTTTGLIETHFLPYAEYRGFAQIPSAAAFGVLSAANIVGMIVVGWLTDKMNRPMLLFGLYVIRAASFILLINVGGSYQTLLVFAIIFGLVDYSTFPVTARLITIHVGTRVTGFAMGLILCGHQLGAAIGAYLGGYFFVIYSQYQFVWWSSAAITAIAGLIVLILLSPKIHFKAGMNTAGLPD